MGGPTIEVGPWADLEGLVGAMDEVGEQMRRTTSYAVAQVCRPDGFATSPGCLLRPLGELLEQVAGAFGEAGRAWYDDWRRLRDATDDALRDLRATDERSAASAATVLREVEPLDRAA